MSQGYKYYRATDHAHKDWIARITTENGLIAQLWTGSEWVEDFFISEYFLPFDDNPRYERYDEITEETAQKYMDMHNNDEAYKQAIQNYLNEPWREHFNWTMLEMYKLSSKLEVPKGIEKI